MARKALRCASVVLAAMFIVGTHAGILRAQQSEAATGVRVFVPFVSGALRAGLAVTGRLTGDCFTASVADGGRPDAWRCMSGNRIMDPCFEGLQGSEVVLACPGTPWSGKVVLLHPAKPLPRAQANKMPLTRALPWALELATGARCQFLTGATSGVAGMRINYGCAGGKTYVIGDVDRSLPRWRVFVVPPKGVAAQLAGVTVAWY